MRWSSKILRIAEIDVYIHFTFLLFLFWIGIVYWNLGHTWQAVASGISFVLVLFLCVILHEFGHALTARHFGYKTRNITIFPIGGVATFDTLPENPKEEILVALAGPAVNIIIALILGIILWASNLPVNIEQLKIENGFSLAALMVINITLAIFNLLPAFPMDGGRVFRAMLSFRRTRYEATKIATKTGQTIAIFLGLIGLMFNPFLVIIALFIWIGAGSESTMEQLKSLLAGISAKQAMVTDFSILSHTDKLARAVSLTLESEQTEFPVTEDGVITKVLTQSDLLRGLSEHGDQAIIGAYATGLASNCSHDTPLIQTFEDLISQKNNLITVTDNRALIGIINLQNIFEFVNFRKALKY